jgi:hypothetical protein
MRATDLAHVRERLHAGDYRGTLDALSNHAPGAEVCWIRAQALAGMSDFSLAAHELEGFFRHENPDSMEDHHFRLSGLLGLLTREHARCVRDMLRAMACDAEGLDDDIHTACLAASLQAMGASDLATQAAALSYGPSAQDALASLAVGVMHSQLRQPQAAQPHFSVATEAEPGSATV